MRAPEGHFRPLQGQYKAYTGHYKTFVFQPMLTQALVSTIFNRPGVAGAVLQTPPWLINWLTDRTDQKKDTLYKFNDYFHRISPWAALV